LIAGSGDGNIVTMVDTSFLIETAAAFGCNVQFTGLQKKKKTKHNIIIVLVANVGFRNARYARVGLY
jgi:hypothetical protein